MAERLAKIEPVPCIVREDAQISAEEDSLAENTHREALHPLDQFRAMQQLVTQGTDIETVAATFMTTPAVVKQRLRLASVSPKLHDVYADDGMTLEQLMAFSVSEDHERQEQVWDLLQSSYNKQPYMIRAKLTEDAVRASDKRVRFVGLDSYVAAGGYVLRDLFEDDQGGFLQDVALLDRLVDEKLKAEGARIGEEGWKWIAVAVDFPYNCDDDMRVIDGDQPAMTEKDEATLASLREEAEALEEEWSGAGDVPDEVETRVTAIDEEISAIISRPLVYQPTEMARAGVFVSIDVDGSLYIERGYVRPEDEPAEESIDGDVDREEASTDLTQREDGGNAGPAIVSVGGVSGSDAGDPRRAAMDLGADMMRDEPDDSFGLRRREPIVGRRHAAVEPVDPQPPIGIEHDLGYLRVVEPASNRRPQRAPQHRSAACVNDGRGLGHLGCLRWFERAIAASETGKECEFIAVTTAFEARRSLGGQRIDCGAVAASYRAR
jgi:ParB family chromosome partitioning protein